MFYDVNKIKFALKSFNRSAPFDHCVIDDFFDFELAKKLESEFPPYSSSDWYFYNNALENKKALNNWDLFPSLTYRVFCDLISENFLKVLKDSLSFDFFSDSGLHGGGWHIHAKGGNLNPHLDYSIHPKLKLQRKLNLILYLSSDLSSDHGGHLGFWSHNPSNNQPKNLIKEIEPKFNRAVIFDTTQFSWHGLSRPLIQPESIFRKSIAVYYLIAASGDIERRERALYAAREDQKDSSEISDLIKNRVDPENFSKFYRT